MHKSILVVFTFVTACSSALGQSLNNSNATLKTKGAYNYLQSLRTQADRSNNRILLGQYGSYNRPGYSDFTTLYWKLAQDQDPVRYLALLGWSVGRTNLRDSYYYEDNIDLKNAVQQAAYFAEYHHCLVTLTWHAKNPWNVPQDKWTGPSELSWKAWTAKDLRGTKGGPVDLKTLLPGKGSRPKGAYREQWLVMLNEMADGLEKLQEQGHTVLWRPFHEMNGDTSEGGFFWWCNQNGEDFKELWIDMFDHFTRTRKLNNLIWIWSAFDSAGHKPYQDYYPGPTYVDVLGVDVYKDPADFSIGDVGWLRERSEKEFKPAVIAELGPNQRKDHRVSFKEYIAKMSQPKYDFFIAVMAWNDWDEDEDPKRTPDVFCSIYENSAHGDNILNLPIVISKEELPALSQPLGK
ncbi:MAG TPA: glycosyl hydrolase [Pirellula sp.]|nr:glycosyl hydrolase [Pirellula sp.]